jgi:hypothetical protein
MRINIVLIPILLLSSISLLASASMEEKGSHNIDKETNSRGKVVYKKSNCAFCHGWAGDGRGHPRSPGAAANLRSSALDRQTMNYIIRCGVVGSAMPYHDRMAYRDNRCVETPEAIATESLPSKGKNIKKSDLESLLDYLMTSIRGKSEITFEQCEMYYKPGSRNCLYLKSE